MVRVLVLSFRSGLERSVAQLKDVSLPCNALDYTMPASL